MSEIGGKTVSEFCAQFVAEALDKDLGVPAILKKTGSQLFTEPLADDLDVLTILRKTLSEFCTQTGSSVAISPRSECPTPLNEISSVSIRSPSPSMATDVSASIYDSSSSCHRRRDPLRGGSVRVQERRALYVDVQKKGATAFRPSPPFSVES